MAVNCKACGTEAPEGTVYCTLCGVHLETGMRANGDSPDSAVYPLLTAANLYRMRSDWDSAEKKCVEVLRLYPNNATAHSLLGDIYASQGRWDDAVQWYELAVDLDPESKSDRAKLEQARRQAISPVPAAGEPAQSGAVPGRRYSPLLQLTAVAVVAFIGTMLLNSVWRRPAEQPPPLPRFEDPRDVGRRAGPAVSPPAASAPQPADAPAAGTGAVAGGANGNAGEPPVGEAQPSQPAAGASEPAASADAPAVPPPDMTEWEARALARLQTGLPSVAPTAGGQVTDVRWDPLRQRALVTARLPQNPGAASLRDEALRGAYRVGQGLVHLGLQRFAVIVKAPMQSGHGPEIVLAAEAESSTGQAWSQDAVAARPEALLTRFAGLWWHPQLR